MLPRARRCDAQLGGKLLGAGLPVAFESEQDDAAAFREVSQRRVQGCSQESVLC